MNSRPKAQVLPHCHNYPKLPLAVRSSYTLPSRQVYGRDGMARVRTGPLRVEATVASNATARVVGPPDRITRRDGPDYEDELILLGLL